MVYKPQGEKTLIGSKIYDDNCTMIWKTTYLRLNFKERSNWKCLKSKHCMSWRNAPKSQHKFSLKNLVVPDEFNKRYPVAYFIYNREDELVLTPLFLVIKERCSDPSIEINFAMTDDNNSGWNAFSRAFRDCQILCKWHVKRACGNKVPLCRNHQLLEDLHLTLQVI